MDKNLLNELLKEFKNIDDTLLIVILDLIDFYNEVSGDLSTLDLVYGDNLDDSIDALRKLKKSVKDYLNGLERL